MATRWVYIKWADSCSPADADWHRLDELNLKALHCDTVGILVAEDQKQVSVASCVGENGAVYGVITIPKCSILKRRRVS